MTFVSAARRTPSTCGISCTATPTGCRSTRLDGTDLWHLRLPVPKGARLEYKFDVVRDGEGAWINDPLNPGLATDPFGANSVGQSLRLRDAGLDPA